MFRFTDARRDTIDPGYRSRRQVPIAAAVAGRQGVVKHFGCLHQCGAGGRQPESRGAVAAGPEHARVLIAQITDTHITLDGRQARDLERILAWLDALDSQADAVIVSGDIANDGRPEQYLRLSGILAGARCPVFLVPGNHDNRAALRSAVPATYYPGAGGESITYAVDTMPVRLIGLDTTAPGRPGGILDRARLAWLEQCLRDGPKTPTLIFMHHPPFRTGVNLADMFGFPGLRRFRALIDRHPHVRRIVSGHVHCERQSTIGNALVTTGLSSTPQLVPELFERRLVGLRPEPAGFALHSWTRDRFASTTYVQAGESFAPRTPDSRR